MGGATAAHVSWHACSEVAISLGDPRSVSRRNQVYGVRAWYGYNFDPFPKRQSCPLGSSGLAHCRRLHIARLCVIIAAAKVGILVVAWVRQLPPMLHRKQSHPFLPCIPSCLASCLSRCPPEGQQHCQAHGHVRDSGRGLRPRRGLGCIQRLHFGLGVASE